jgi:hypothetical protein
MDDVLGERPLEADSADELGERVLIGHHPQLRLGELPVSDVARDRGYGVGLADRDLAQRELHRQG